MNRYIALIGLGAVGTPLADRLFTKYSENFVLLSSEDFLHTLEDLYINGQAFSPGIISSPEQQDKRIAILFVCVKNYHVPHVSDLIRNMIDTETIIVPLQNGVYSFDYFSKEFPDNPVLEGFAQGPNTQATNNVYVYQKPGFLKIGSSCEKNKRAAEMVYKALMAAGIEVYLSDHIKHEVWTKLMLNVAGNAITALTGIDYCMFKNSADAQKLCKMAMEEFTSVARTQGIEITEQDIRSVIAYYLSFTVSKHTSMLEDVLNKRPTENDYIAGYIRNLARVNGLSVPCIEMLYGLMRIKEQVYLNIL